MNPKGKVRAIICLMPTSAMRAISELTPIAFVRAIRTVISKRDLRASNFVKPKEELRAIRKMMPIFRVRAVNGLIPTSAVRAKDSLIPSIAMRASLILMPKRTVRSLKFPFREQTQSCFNILAWTVAFSSSGSRTFTFWASAVFVWYVKSPFYLDRYQSTTITPAAARPIPMYRARLVSASRVPRAGRT